MRRLSIASIFILSIFDLADMPGKVVFEEYTCYVDCQAPGGMLLFLGT
jgi:hypothetical protein